MMPGAVVTALALGTLLTAPQSTFTLWPTPLNASRVQEWADAVDKHEPGKADDAVRSIARWSADELYQLFNEFRALDAFNKNPLVSKRPLNGARYPSPQFEKNIMLLLRLTPDERRTGNINRLLLRAAVLHTDAQFVAPATPEVNVFNRASPFSGNLASTASDGRQTNIENTATHIEFTSWILDGIRRDASADSIVRSWYENVAAQLHRSQRLGDTEWILQRGRRLYPDDAVLQFLSGTVEAWLATPAMQAGLRMPLSFDQKPLDNEQNLERLKQAQTFFMAALNIYPGHLEARLHLGRVLGLMGDHVHAVDMLTEVLSKAAIAEHRYYAMMFLAREQDASGNPEAARNLFEQAATLFPKAQSPLLALSELARRRGDSPGAQRALERLLALTGVNDRADPCWWFFIFHVGDARIWLDMWRGLVTAAVTR